MAGKKKKKKFKKLECNTNSNESTTSTDTTFIDSTSGSSSEEDNVSSQGESRNSTTKRKPDILSSPEHQPQQKIANCMVTPKTATEQSTFSNVNEDSASTKSSDTSGDSHALLIDESDSNASSENSTTSPMDISGEKEQIETHARDDQFKNPNDEQTLIPTEEGTETSDTEQTETPDAEPTVRHVEYSYTLNLPTVKQLISQKSLPTPDIEESKEERLKSVGQFAKAIMMSPTTRDHTIEKELQYQERVKSKTIFGACPSEKGDLPYLKPEELLTAVAKHLNKDQFESFYKIAGDKFVIVLKEDRFKEDYLTGVHFREQVQGHPLNFTISSTPMGKKPPKSQIGTRFDENTVFVTMYLPSTISNIAVKKVFQEFGTVHTVFNGTFKGDLQGIRNGKRHIRLTPDGSKHDLPHRVQFPGDNRYFNVLWKEKIVSCKKCLSEHMISISCDKAFEENNVSQPDSTIKVTDPNDPKTVTNPSPPSVDQDTVKSDKPMVPDVEEPDHVTGPAIPEPVTWDSIPDEVPSDSRPIVPALPEGVTCVDDSNRDNAASLVPAKVTGTKPGCNDALASPNKVNSQIFPNGEVLSSDPVSKSDDSLNATATAVATKLSSRLGDKGPP